MKGKKNLENKQKRYNGRQGNHKLENPLRHARPTRHGAQAGSLTVRPAVPDRPSCTTSASVAVG
jgi:hypothetical protein